MERYKYLGCDITWEPMDNILDVRGIREYHGPLEKVPDDWILTPIKIALTNGELHNYYQIDGENTTL